MSLPSDWQRKKVRDLCNLVNGDAYKPSDWSDVGTRIIRIQNLNDISKPFNFWAGKLDNRVLIKDGDVLIAWSGTPGTSFGAHIWNRGKAVLNQHIFRVDFKSSMVMPEWFKLAINQSLYILIQRAHGGVGLRHVTRREVDELVIPLPPLPEQERIVCLLDEAEQLRKLRGQASARMDEFVPALFYEMFGDPGFNPNKWRSSELSSVCLKVTDGTHWPPEFSPEGIPFLFVSNMVNGFIDFNTKKYITEDEYEKLAKRVRPSTGDILYSTVGSYGVATLVETDRKFQFQRHIGYIKSDPKYFLPEFLCVQLNTPFVKSQVDQKVRGVAQKTLNLAELKKIIVIVPPLALQREFAQRAQEAREIQSRQARSAERVEALYQSLLSRAFAGEL